MFEHPVPELVQPKNDWLDEVSYTVEIFPGNPIARPNMSFVSSSRIEKSIKCRKSYRKSGLHSPGIFTVQCVSRYLKLFDFSVMNEFESVSTAMSILLSRFKHLAMAKYYDNGCNLSKSVLLRFQSIDDGTIIMNDRFHNRSHKCNTATDSDNYAICKSHHTLGAE